MKKTIVPICIVIFLMFVGSYLIIVEYVKQKANNEVKEDVIDEDISLSEEEEAVNVILLNINEEKEEMAFQNISNGKIYSFPYDSSCQVLSKYGNALSIRELEYGEVMKLDYSVHAGKLNAIQLSDDIWTYTDVTKFSFDEQKKIMTIAEDAYQITDKLVIFSENKEAEIMDITDMDTLRVYGVGQKILSIIVDKGHGYLRLKNDAYFVGGFIEIGQEIMKPITEDMLIHVPEGKYKVRITNRGYAGEEEVEIKRNEEFSLDLSKIDVEEIAIGHIRFDIEPEYAQLYIDDEITEYVDRVPLEFGIHQMRVEAAGYETVTGNIKIKDDYANIKVVLDEESKEDEEDDDESSSSSTSNITTSSTYKVNSTGLSSSSSSSTEQDENTLSKDTISSSTKDQAVVSGDAKIFIEEPAGVEVYIDGNYVGMAPVTTAKVTGIHVVTLSKDGYQTKSYTINVSNDSKNVTFSFSNLSKGN